MSNNKTFYIISITLLVAILAIGGYILWEKGLFNVLVEETKKPMTEEEIEEYVKAAYYFSLEMALGAHEIVYRLELSNKEMEKLSPQVGRLKELRYLNLSNNNLSEIPKEIGYLTKLRELFLTSNNLSTLPEEISNLKNLEFLYLGDNNFTEEEIEKIKEMLPKTEILSDFTILPGEESGLEEEETEEIEEIEDDEETEE